MTPREKVETLLITGAIGLVLFLALAIVVQALRDELTRGL